MTDRELLLERLERLAIVLDELMPQCAELVRDAIELLKEQQQRIEQLEIDRDILVKDINTNNCNTCKRECEHRPIPGDVVRVNCFMWEGRGNENETMPSRRWERQPFGTAGKVFRAKLLW